MPGNTGVLAARGTAQQGVGLIKSLKKLAAVLCFTGSLGGLGSSQSWGDSRRRIRTISLLSGIFEEHFFALPSPILCTCPPSPVLSLWCFVIVLWVTPLVFPKMFSHLRHMMFFFLVAYRDQICLPSIICLLLVGNA